MATVGDTLTAPEAGWQRIQDSDPNFIYIGQTWQNRSDPLYSGGTAHTSYPNGSEELGMQIKFNFKGSKLRIISQTNYAGTSNIEIEIDGITDTFTEYAVNLGATGCQRLVYEKLDLQNAIHSVVITKTSNEYIQLDAIDIDSTGAIMPYNPQITIAAPINLTATAGDSQVSLSWDAVTSATGYNVKRSTTAGGPYTTVGSNVSGTSYIDTAVVDGTTYYYVVTALNGTSESANSNEASATPEGHNLLRITMSDSSEREYEVNTTEFASFLTWFNRTIGTENSYYSFDKTVGSQSSTEYLAFEKIISFKTMTVNEQVILKIIMSDSSEREYKVSSADAFVNWHERTVSPCASGTTDYEFTDSIDGSTEYLSFEKIISFEVIPLAK